VKADWSADRDPLAALQAGRSDLFAEFVLVETPALLGFFRRLGAGMEEAEDLTQELFVRLYRLASQYKASERFEPLCFRVARNAWIDAERRRSARPRAALGPEMDNLDERESDGQSPLRAAAGSETSARLERAVASLPEGQRLVFELGLVQELAYPDVAAALGIPVGTVKSRMFHALRRLRVLLGDTLDGADGGPSERQTERQTGAQHDGPAGGAGSASNAGRTTDGGSIFARVHGLDSAHRNAAPHSEDHR